MLAKVAIASVLMFLWGIHAAPEDCLPLGAVEGETNVDPHGSGMEYTFNQTYTGDWTLLCAWREENDCMAYGYEFWPQVDSANCTWMPLFAEGDPDQGLLYDGCLRKEFTGPATQLDFRMFPTSASESDLYHACVARVSGSDERCEPALVNEDSGGIVIEPCFPGWARVRLETGEDVALSNLTLGSRVQCTTPDGIGYCPVNSYINANPPGSPRATFVRLYYKLGAGVDFLSATLDHYVFVADPGVGAGTNFTTRPAGTYKQAHTVVVGDLLLRAIDDETMQTFSVIRTSKSKEDEYYTFAAGGSSEIFVERMLASSFAYVSFTPESHEAMRNWNAPLWQTLDESQPYLGAGVKLSELPRGLHPWVVARKQALLGYKMSGRPVNVQAWADHCAELLANGTVFSFEFYDEELARFAGASGTSRRLAARRLGIQCPATTSTTTTTTTTTMSTTITSTTTSTSTTSTSTSSETATTTKSTVTATATTVTETSTTSLTGTSTTLTATSSTATSTSSTATSTSSTTTTTTTTTRVAWPGWADAAFGQTGLPSAALAALGVLMLY